MAGGEGAELKPQATHYIFVTRVLYVYTLLTTRMRTLILYSVQRIVISSYFFLISWVGKSVFLVSVLF